MSEVDINAEKKENGTFPEDQDEGSQEELVDPRVQVELERLNTATDLINKLEIELDEARSNFRLLLSESSMRVNHFAKKLGACVEKARPYYEARMHAKQLQTQTQKAALRYERASSAHSAAKEMVFLAEEGLKKEGRCFDPAWQEMLNHATLRVNEAESERVLSQHEHQKTSSAYNESERIVQHLHKELKKSIVKSSLSTRRSLLQLNNLANQHQLQLLPYFEMKAQFNQLLEGQRKNVHRLEENILKMKMSYADALHNLEEISDEIHQKRRSEENRISSERSETEGAECLSYSHDNIKMPYHKFNSNSTSADNIYIENLNTEDVYMSLPSNMTLRPGIIAASCKGSDFQHIPCLPPPGLELCVDESKHKIWNINSAAEKTLMEHALNNSQAEKLSAAADSSTVSRHLEKLNLSNKDNKYEETKPTEIQDKSSEGEEIPDFRFLAPDFNILRVQREELSDSESLASNDTTDTLDDNQIECLLLEKALPLDVQEIDAENCLRYKSKENIHL